MVHACDFEPLAAPALPLLIAPVGERNSSGGQQRACQSRGGVAPPTTGDSLLGDPIAELEQSAEAPELVQRADEAQSGFDAFGQAFAVRERLKKVLALGCETRE